jgi:hypothetical protein
MANTVHQPSANPTRKLSAAVIGIAIVEVARTALTNFAPEWSEPSMWTALSPVIVFACGWFVKDEPNISVTVEESK